MIAHASRRQAAPATRGVVIAVIASVVLSAMALLAASPIAVRAVDESPSGRYTVLHPAAPLAAYGGGIAGLAATDPTVTGADRLDVSSAASQAYLGYLGVQHDALEGGIEAALGRDVNVVFRYTTVVNGLAVDMSAAEAGIVSGLANVARVVADVELELLTDNGPAWIGAPSVWDGAATGTGTRGERIVAGIIDTSINTDHPSFADVGGDGFNHTNPHGTFHGLCDPLTGAPFCNDKLIGVWDFTGVGTGPEDDNGHGSHTASTVAGNVLQAALTAPTITIERAISGVAPHANVIAYKACATTPAAGACLQTGTVASIDQAVRDGVDVINFSIGGGSRDPWTDLNGIAFLNAQRAGVYASVSAGNDGPGAATVGSPADSPWVTAVGASTHDRKFTNSLVGMSGGATAAPADIAGQSVTAGYGSATIVYAGDLGFPLCGDGPANEATGDAALNPFPPGTFNGEIVLCDRGTYGRVEKASNVMEGGAGGFVLANDEPSGDSLIADAYPIPGVHITYADGLVVKEWLAGGDGHTASITGTLTNISDANGDVMASFSSRGQNPSVPGVIKPDVTAPGVDILAAFDTPIGSTGGAPEYNVISGTSMSSPHNAGAAALLRALHPEWAPDEVRSALMTTAVTDGLRKEDAATPADPFDLGAGRIELSGAAAAGLVLNETAAAYEAANPTAGGDPSTLNLPSLGDADCAGTCAWTRTLTSVTASEVTWTASVSAPPGFGLSVSPSTFTLAGGATQSIDVTADVSGVAGGQWHFATVRLVPSDPSVPAVHLPVAVLAAGGSSVPTTTLHFQGNADEGCLGEGSADLIACDGPFLSTNETLDDGLAAVWLAGSLVDGTADRNIYDPNWVWNLDSPTTVAGPMTVRWWGACPACAPPAGTADWTIRLWADGVQVIEQRVTAAPAAATGPSLLEATIVVPESTATGTFVLHVDPVYVDTQNPSAIFYDSTGGCTPTVSGPCDSVVLMPIVGAEPIAQADLRVTDMSASDTKAKAGKRVVISATVTNTGDADSPASSTEFRLDDGSLIGTAEAPPLVPGQGATVSVTWDTRGLNGECVITATGDAAGAVDESDEANNAGILTVEVRGNKVRNSSFEGADSSGSAPDGWSRNDTPAGETAWSEGGSDGEHAVTISGTGSSAALGGLPTWTSEPIAVAAGEVLTLSASVSSSGASSAATVGLAYLGPLGEVLDTVTHLSAPLTTDGFALLEETLTVPSGVTQVRVVLSAFAPTDLRTAGTVTFDEIGLYAQ